MALNFNKLQGKHVLVFGGSTGLGKGAAEGALAAGASVTLVSSSQAKLDASMAGLRKAVPAAKVKSVEANLLNQEIDEILETVRTSATEHFGPIHHIVFTASDWFPLVPVKELTPELFVKSTRLRVVVPLILAKQIASGGWLERDRASSLTLTGGNASNKPTPGFLLPALIGSGLEGMVRALALELAPIRVNIVAPGFVDTGLWGAAREALAARQDAMVLTGKAGQVEDVAEAYVYLMKDGYTTGQAIRTEGGSTLLSREAGGR